VFSRSLVRILYICFLRILLWGLVWVFLLRRTLTPKDYFPRYKLRHVVIIDCKKLLRMTLGWFAGA
jgi:hypothetical protein